MTDHRNNPLSDVLAEALAQNDPITRLEQATEGSRELDLEIGRELHPDSLIADNQRLSGALPRYTTSLDAKLPWENIAHVHAPDWHSAQPSGRWQAAQDCGEGHAVYGYGATEALARRIAALRAKDNG